MQFGLYLKNRGIISAEQLVAALDEQLSRLVPIGQIAIEEGILNAREVFNVLLEQGKFPNERFGDLAIEMRLMTRDDLMWLLMIQADRKHPISEILIRQGVLTERQVATEMAAFRRAQGRMGLDGRKEKAHFAAQSPQIEPAPGRRRRHRHECINRLSDAIAAV